MTSALASGKYIFQLISLFTRTSLSGLVRLATPALNRMSLTSYQAALGQQFAGWKLKVKNILRLLIHVLHAARATKRCK